MIKQFVALARPRLLVVIKDLVTIKDVVSRPGREVLDRRQPDGGRPQTWVTMKDVGTIKEFVPPPVPGSPS